MTQPDVDPALALYDNAVKRNAVTGTDLYDIADNSGTGRNLADSTVFVKKNGLRTKINGFHDLTAALFNRAVFECFTDPVEEHNSDRLPKLADTESADGRDAH